MVFALVLLGAMLRSLAVRFEGMSIEQEGCVGKEGEYLLRGETAMTATTDAVRDGDVSVYMRVDSSLPIGLGRHLGSYLASALHVSCWGCCQAELDCQ